MRGGVSVGDELEPGVLGGVSTVRSLVVAMGAGMCNVSAIFMGRSVFDLFVFTVVTVGRETFGLFVVIVSRRTFDLFVVVVGRTFDLFAVTVVAVGRKTFDLLLVVVGSTFDLFVATMEISEVGRLWRGSNIRARRMLISAGVRALGPNPVDRLSLELVERVSWLVAYWAGCNRAFTISARNCSSPVGVAGLPFCKTVAAKAYSVTPFVK